MKMCLWYTLYAYCIYGYELHKYSHTVAFSTHDIALSTCVYIYIYIICYFQRVYMSTLRDGEKKKGKIWYNNICTHICMSGR